MPSEKTDSPEKKFLEVLADTLSLKKTIEKLNLKEEEARGVLKSILKELFPDTSGLYMYIDGASRGNPGEAGAGAVIKDTGGHVLKRLKKRLGIATNNVAEYMAFIMALTEAKKLGAKKVHAFSDSELLVRQINGQYRVKSEGLKTLYREAISIKEGFSFFKLTHIEREKNSEADFLANSAIDGI